MEGWRVARPARFTVGHYRSCCDGMPMHKPLVIVLAAGHLGPSGAPAVQTIETSTSSLLQETVLSPTTMRNFDPGLDSPVRPGGPCGPGSPFGPIGPVGPTAPLSPWAPGIPSTPCGPCPQAASRRLASATVRSVVLIDFSHCTMDVAPQFSDHSVGRFGQSSL